MAIGERGRRDDPPGRGVDRGQQREIRGGLGWPSKEEKRAAGNRKRRETFLRTRASRWKG